MKIISRSDWGAIPARPGVLTCSPHIRTEFMVHYSDGPADQSVAAIQHWCMSGRGFLDIDYNFLVRGTTGEIYEGRGWDAVGSHCIGHNTSAIGVCVIGTGQLSEAAKASVRALYAEAVALAGHSLRILGHRDAYATDCPGDGIYRWVHSGDVAGPRQLKLTSPPMEGADVREVQEVVHVKADGIFGPVTSAAVRAWQKAHGLDDDGIVGPLTRARMGL